MTTTKTEMVTEATLKAVRVWLDKDGGDVEKTARWMRRALRIGTLGECRAIVAQAAAL